MSEAERVARDLEERRKALMLRVRHLEAQMPEICYRVAVEESFIARAELEALTDELIRLGDEHTILRHAFFHAVKKVTQRDAHAVMAELGLTEQPND
jgi:spore coat polysaccharide biosynthesis predicted glycosyltransferase SpsG